METKTIIGMCILSLLIVGCVDTSNHDIIMKNLKLEYKCEKASEDYDYWWDAPECKEYVEYHDWYENWLIEGVRQREHKDNQEG